MSSNVSQLIKNVLQVIRNNVVLSVNGVTPVNGNVKIETVDTFAGSKLTVVNASPGKQSVRLSSVKSTYSEDTENGNKVYTFSPEPFVNYSVSHAFGTGSTVGGGNPIKVLKDGSSQIVLGENTSNLHDGDIIKLENLIQDAESAAKYYDSENYIWSEAGYELLRRCKIGDFLDHINVSSMSITFSKQWFNPGVANLVNFNGDCSFMDFSECKILSNIASRANFSNLSLSGCDLSKVEKANSLLFYSNIETFNLTNTGLKPKELQGAFVCYTYSKTIDRQVLYLDGVDTSLCENFKMMFKSLVRGVVQEVHWSNGVDMSSLVTAYKSYEGATSLNLYTERVNCIWDSKTHTVEDFPIPVHFKNVPSNIIASGSSPSDWTFHTDVQGVQGIDYIIDSIREPTCVIGEPRG